LPRRWFYERGQRLNDQTSVLDVNLRKRHGYKLSHGGGYRTPLAWCEENTVRLRGTARVAMPPLGLQASAPETGWFNVLRYGTNASIGDLALGVRIFCASRQGPGRSHV
jgi:hypothetical protein